MKDARVCSRRAFFAVLLAVVWVIASLVGPRVLSLASGNWIVIGAGTILYGGLTIAAMAGLVWQSSALAFDRYTRRVVQMRLLPFPVLLALAAIAAGGTGWGLSGDMLAASWCAVKAFLSVLLLGVSLARFRELRGLREELESVIAEEAQAVAAQPSWPGSLHNWPTLPQIR